MKQILSLLLLAAMFTITGCNVDSSENTQEEQEAVQAQQQAPVRVEKTQGYNQVWNYTYEEIVITSIVDSVTINSVKINRGNCKNSSFDLPKTLKYGHTYYVQPSKGCSVLLVEIQTDKGDWSVEY